MDIFQLTTRFFNPVTKFIELVERALKVLAEFIGAVLKKPFDILCVVVFEHTGSVGVHSMALFGKIIGLLSC